MGIMDNFKEVGRIKKMADDAKKETEHLRATGRSKRGYITITLDGDKAIKSIEFSEDTANLPREELAKLTKEAHSVAVKEIDKMLKKQFKNSGLANMLMGKQ
ncbi:MAG: YbaB/EbfC family nucleoid-associated protein [Brevinematales bacterium]|nr:YbaB/EbfC family nucleoid-associated protein [Brevinematales bacterium]